MSTMRMGTLEKLFVNSSTHSRRVSRDADRRLRRIAFSAGQRYLDMGCGNGIAPIYLALKHGLEVTGVDIDPEQVRLARKNAWDIKNARFLEVDGTSLPFEDASFDIVATNKVTHHIPDWPAALAEMIRVLRPHGYLLYGDLVWPGWLHRMTGRGPTRTTLESFFEGQPVSLVRARRSGLLYEAVCRRTVDPVGVD